jgi:malate dehydrogenase (quinone)
MPDTTIRSQSDVVLIGAGIMSASWLNLKELQPDIKIEIYERLDMAAAESSDAWNNAGTGHSAFVNSIILQKAMMVVLIPKKRSVLLNL